MNSRFAEKLKLKTQILILQSLIAALILTILISLSLILVDVFSTFIKNQLVESLILKNILSSMQISVGSLGNIGQIEYYQQIADKQSSLNLYDFQVKYKVQMFSQLDNCLQIQYSQQFYSYQSCYGIYGKIANQSNLSQIMNYVSLQNLFIPFKQQIYNLATYTVQLDQSLFVSQYQGAYIKQLNQELMNAIFFMAFFQFPGYFKQIPGETGQMLLMFTVIPGTRIAQGTLLNQNQQQFFQLTKQQKYYRQRLLGLLDSGIILTDTENMNVFGLMFQNTSITGFNETQFQKIKNFTYKNFTVLNECESQVQGKILCLIDVNQQNKLIFSQIIQNQGLPFLQIVIIDAIPIKQIRDQFNYQLDILYDRIVFNIVVSLLVTVFICCIIQIFFMARLNQPLQQIQNIAQYHINNQEYKFLQVIRLNKAQSEIQQLQDAFFNLINTDNMYRRFKGRSSAQYHNQFPLAGLLQLKYSQRIFKQIKSQIFDLPTYSKN